MKARTIGALLMLLGLAAPAHAQLAWDSPLLVPPRAAPGFGIFLIEPAGGSLGALATLRPSGAASRLQFRVGLAEDDPGDDLAILGGVDVSDALVTASDDFPIDVSWVAGAGIGVGDFVNVAFPFGLILGQSFAGDGVTFTPYVSPRIVVDGTFDAPGDDGLGLDLAVDVGLDLAFADGWLIRFGGTIGDREALAIGLVF